MALLLLFAYTVAWIGAWVGLYMPNPETANTAGLIWLFPLTFLSNAFVPINSLPGVLQTIAAWNPISALVLACRELFGNPTGYSMPVLGNLFGTPRRVALAMGADEAADPLEWHNLAGDPQHAAVKETLAAWLPDENVPDADEQSTSTSELSAEITPDNAADEHDTDAVVVPSYTLVPVRVTGLGSTVSTPGLSVNM